MVVALKPLHDRWKIKRVVVATYQSVSGAGNRGSTQLQQEIDGAPVTEKKFAHRIAFNVLPHIDVFFDDGYTREEHKMVKETQKIMGDSSIKVNATCVRVPVYVGHSESVNVEFEMPFDIAEARQVLASAPGVVVQDSPAENYYPLAINAVERDEVFVGRLRRDDTVPNGLTMWIVSDNLRKGAATNAVQIAEEWIKGK